MTNEEEKILEEILDEENDITLEKAAEEAEDLQEETQDEVKEVREEIPDDVRLDPDEIRERPVLRGGLRGAADPNMIQKHIDNFLAMLCGETPVDSNVRTSAEYWLKRLATGEGAGSTKKIYRHTIYFVKQGGGGWYVDGYVMLFNNSPEAISKTAFIKLLNTDGFYGVVINGRTSAGVSDGTAANVNSTAHSIFRSGSTTYITYEPFDTHVATQTSMTISADYFTVTDLAIDPIN